MKHIKYLEAILHGGGKNKAIWTLLRCPFHLCTWLHCERLEIQLSMTNLDYRAQIQREIRLRCDSDIYLHGGEGGWWWGW